MEKDKRKSIMSTDKENFLNHIRFALNNYPSAPGTLPTEQEYQRNRQVNPETNLIARFIELAQESKMNVYPVQNPNQLQEELSNLIRKRNLKTIMLSEDPLLESMQIKNTLQAISDIEIFIPDFDNDTFVSDVFQVSAAISVPHLALAETGSFVLIAKPYQPRLLSIAPPIQISILPANSLKADLFDLLMTENFFQSQTTLVTSPSKTADIEMALVYGAHGPIEEHIFLVNN
jgi:L-lactate dehydrogenase complex protein LldG